MVNSDLAVRDLSFIKNIVFVEKGSLNKGTTLFDFLPCYIFVFKIAHNKVYYVNKKMQDDFSLEDESIKSGLEIETILAEEDAEQFKIKAAALNKLDDGATLSFEYRLLNGGNPNKYKVTGIVVKSVEHEDDSIVFIHEEIIGDKNNIGDKKIIEESTEDLQHYKQMMHEKETFLQLGSWEYNSQGKNFAFSDGMFILYGYEQPFTIQSNIDLDFLKKHIEGEDFNRIYNEVSQLAGDKNCNSFLCEYKLTTLTGESRTVETYAKFIRNNEGGVINVLGTARDVTQLKEYERSLEQKIVELNKSNSDLEDFAYVASHDLQEPLRKITTFGERLVSKYGDLIEDDGKTYLSRMMKAAANMKALIDNLLEFSRLRLKNQKPDLVDLNKTLKDVITDLELRVEEANAELVIENLPLIEGFSTQLKQLFFNLVGNALKFRKLGVDTRIEIKCRELTAKDKDAQGLGRASSWFEITLKDNGIGFEQIYAEKIFQIFQRLHGKSDYAGSGIGLAICKKIVDNHKGIISATGVLGEGAEFLIYLPAKQ